MKFCCASCLPVHKCSDEDLYLISQGLTSKASNKLVINSVAFYDHITRSLLQQGISLSDPLLGLKRKAPRNPQARGRVEERRLQREEDGEYVLDAAPPPLTLGKSTIRRDFNYATHVYIMYNIYITRIFLVFIQLRSWVWLPPLQDDSQRTNGLRSRRGLFSRGNHLSPVQYAGRSFSFSLRYSPNTAATVNTLRVLFLTCFLSSVCPQGNLYFRIHTWTHTRTYTKHPPSSPTSPCSSCMF